MVKNLPANPATAVNMVLIPVLGRFSVEGNGNPLKYSFQENPMNRGAWEAIIHGAAKS